MQQPLFYEEDIPKIKTKKKLKKEPIQEEKNREKQTATDTTNAKEKTMPTLEQVLSQMDADNTEERTPEPSIDLEEELERRSLIQTEPPAVQEMPDTKHYWEKQAAATESMQKVLAKIYKRRPAGTADCSYRQGTLCKKTGKKIALDCRQIYDRKYQKNVACWERMHCDDYEKPLKEKDPI